MKRLKLNIFSPKGDNAKSGQKNPREKASRRTVWLAPALGVTTVGILLILFSTPDPSHGQTISTTTVQTAATDLANRILQSGLAMLNAIPEPLDAPTDPPGFFQVKPQEFDPGKTNLVQAAWLHGTGCPTNATIALPNGAFTGVGSFSSYTDPACTTGDLNDRQNEGLLLVKTGPTTNFAAAGAELHNVKGIMLTELGYDIRKYGPGTYLGAQGSHCGAGAPRFNILTTTNFYFLGCSSPPRDFETDGDGWIRLRWGVGGVVTAFCATCAPPLNFTLQPITGTVRRIQIVFDEGYATTMIFSPANPGGAPDEFGGALLDNIDVNGALVGRGATDAS